MKCLIVIDGESAKSLFAAGPEDIRDYFGPEWGIKSEDFVKIHFEEIQDDSGRPISLKKAILDGKPYKVLTYKENFTREKIMKNPPNCYECKHRGTIAWDCHSRCLHPCIGELSNQDLLLTMTERVVPDIIKTAKDRLNIKGNMHGIRNGWFFWPVNFDPVWLKSCNGFEPKKG